MFMIVTTVMQRFFVYITTTSITTTACQPRVFAAAMNIVYMRVLLHSEDALSVVYLNISPY